MAKTHIVIITDAWDPQVNGVVTSYKNIINNLPDNVEVTVIHPGMFRTLALPFYKGIDLALCSYSRMRKIINRHRGAYFHIATEGILGLQARRVLNARGVSYTTAYHTKFPEFIKAMYKLPIWSTRWYFNWFHSKSKYVICSSESSANENPQWNAVVVGKGYDKHFGHDVIISYKNNGKCKNPTLLFVGRVSKEKNIEEFCSLDYMNKIVVGDGPDLKRLQEKYPDVDFVGYKFGKELADYYRDADVFVFPSRSDTYGIVILEAMACGTPVAAYPVTGPKDQIIEGVNGSMHEDLHIAIEACLNIPRKRVSDSVQNISWARSAKQFVEYVIHENN